MQKNKELWGYTNKNNTTKHAWNDHKDTEYCVFAVDDQRIDLNEVLTILNLIKG